MTWSKTLKHIQSANIDPKLKALLVSTFEDSEENPPLKIVVRQYWWVDVHYSIKVTRLTILQYKIEYFIGTNNRVMISALKTLNSVGKSLTCSAVDLNAVM